jgi:predicted metalloprotease
MFSNATQTACGPGMTAMGPFYCPLDRKVYIDLNFYQEMRSKFGIVGDGAQAYVIAHEMGHHVQNLLGVAEQVQKYKQQVSEAEANALQVRMELQADCYAGVWANMAERSKGILEQGDIEEALNAASAIGDDNIQRQTQGRVVPDAFTHGTSEQRARWLTRGYESGKPSACDTFDAADL